MTTLEQAQTELRIELYRIKRRDVNRVLDRLCEILNVGDFSALPEKVKMLVEVHDMAANTLNCETEKVKEEFAAVQKLVDDETSTLDNNVPTDLASFIKWQHAEIDRLRAEIKVWESESEKTDLQVADLNKRLAVYEKIMAFEET